MIKSDKQKVFKTGAMRDSSVAKPPMVLLPYDLMDRVAFLYGEGGAVYGDNNYRLGQRSSDVFDSMSRHMRAYYMGKTDEDHLAAIIWNAFCLMNNETYYRDDEYICDLQGWFKDGRPTGKGRGQ